MRGLRYSRNINSFWLSSPLLQQRNNLVVFEQKLTQTINGALYRISYHKKKSICTNAFITNVCNVKACRFIKYKVNQEPNDVSVQFWINYNQS